MLMHLTEYPHDLSSLTLIASLCNVQQSHAGSYAIAANCQSCRHTCVTPSHKSSSDTAEVEGMQSPHMGTAWHIAGSFKRLGKLTLC